MKKKSSKPINRKKTSISLKGIGASPGICIGEAYILEKSYVNLPRYWINNKEIPNEISRFHDALDKTRNELEKIKEKLCKFEGREQIHILDAYSMILQDEMLLENTSQTIQSEHINAEWALYKNLEKIKNVFVNVEDTHLRDRTSDFDYIGERILKHLIGKTEDLFKNIPQNSVIISHDLSPAETAQLMKFKIKGIVTEIGGKTSHTAIISRALEIPAVVACNFITQKANRGDPIIVDGRLGQVVLNPSAKVKKSFEENRQHQDALQKILLKDIHLPAETKDKFRIRLAANMELTEELSSIKENGAEGIGLYRTEFLFLNQKSLPSEEEHFENYKKVLKTMYPQTTTIRTIDIGGDKIPIGHLYETETNPALGLRAIRFSFREKQLFKTQLRAMLRASAFGKLKILIPMISDLEEVRKVKTILEEVKKELIQEKIDFDPKTQLGIMIEVPSAALIAEELAREVDFFNIGTNDLIQYTLAIDRSNEHVAYLYRPLNPSILRILNMIIEGAKKANIEVSVCGEMASEPIFILILLGFGLHELSMNALSIPKAKRIIRSVEYKQAHSLLEKCLQFKTTSEVENFVKKELQGLLGENFKEFS